MRIGATRANFHASGNTHSRRQVFTILQITGTIGQHSLIILRERPFHLIALEDNDDIILSTNIFQRNRMKRQFAIYTKSYVTVVEIE